MRDKIPLIMNAKEKNAEERGKKTLPDNAAKDWEGEERKGGRKGKVDQRKGLLAKISLIMSLAAEPSLIAIISLATPFIKRRLKPLITLIH